VLDTDSALDYPLSTADGFARIERFGYLELGGSCARRY
jgi:hypothetical protein